MKKISKFLLLVATGLLVTTSCTPKSSSQDSSSPTTSLPSSSSSESNSSSSSSSSSNNPTSSSSQEKVKPTLTQSMLDVFDTEYISFDGSHEVALYDIRNGKYQESYSYNVSTAMDGTYWTATYLDGGLGTNRTLFYKNNNDLACEVSVNLMNEENYLPVLDEKGNTISWADSGMHNYLDELVVSDFSYNDTTGRYHYIKPDKTLAQNIVDSANPYDFVVKDLSLIIADGEIIGINAVSEFDSTIAAGSKAEQTLIATINYGQDIVELNKIEKFEYIAEIHDPLKEAIENMQELTSYKTKVRVLMQTIYTSGITGEGYIETVTPTDLYFQKITLGTTSNPEDSIVPNSEYGYHKFSDDDYNSYYTSQDGANLVASRAYKGSMNKAQPSFAFAPEIMTGYSYDEANDEKYYYVDVNMSNVATTFYNGVGNDINTYGIFATEGFTSATESFTPYVVVKDGYITYACFYFNLGLMYGVVEISYSDFNTATLPTDVEIDFTQRQIPTSWDQLEFILSSDSGNTSDDTYTNAGTYLKTFFENENILNDMPFFGGIDYLGDTYGFGMTSQYRPEGMGFYINALTLYYDVPLDLNYSINSSMEKVYQCLEDKGFTNRNGTFVKGDISVVPVDNELDLMIYIYRTSDFQIV